MKLLVVALIAAFLSTLGRAAPAHAFVPAAFSLAEVYRDAEAVVVARAGATRDIGSTTELYDHKTTMTLIKVLKGPPTFPKSFELATDHRGSCNSDVHFSDGGHALVFLRWSADDKAYKSVGRSEGSFPLTDALEAEVNLRVPELGEILTIDDEAKRHAALTEFYVRLCLDPTTRAIGAHSLYLDTRSWLPSKTAAVSATQSRRLAAALSKERPPRDAADALVWLLAEYPDPELDAYLHDSLRQASDPKWLPIMWRAAEILPKRLKVELPPELKADFDEHRKHTYWIDGEMSRLEEYYFRQRPALMERLLKVFERRK